MNTPRNRCAPRAGAWSVVAASVLLATVVTPAAAAQAELIHHWKLDESSASTVAVDAVRGANGSVGGTGAFATGKIGSAAFRTGGFNLGFVNAGNVPITNSFVLSFWVNPDDPALDWRNMISKHDVANQRAFWVGQHGDNGRMRFGMYFDGQNESTVDSTSAVLSAGQWAHVAVAWDEQAKTQSLYVNGQLAGSALRPGKSFLTPRSSNLLFNTNHTSADPTINIGSWARFDGAVDDVAVWDRPLSFGKVRAMHQVAQQPALSDYNAADMQRLFRAYDTNFPQQIGSRRWTYTPGLSLGEGNAATLPNGHAVQFDADGRGASALSTITLSTDPRHTPGVGDSIGSSLLSPMQLHPGDVYVMLWTTDLTGADDRAALRAELDAVSGTAYDLVTPTEPLWSQLWAQHPGFDTLVRFNSAGVVGAVNWDFASRADVIVTQTAVVSTGQAVPEPAAVATLAAASLALLTRRRR